MDLFRAVVIAALLLIGSLMALATFKADEPFAVRLCAFMAAVSAFAVVGALASC